LNPVALSRAHAIGGNFHLADPAERKKQSDEILGRVLRRLFDDVADRVGDGGVEGYLLDLHTREVDADQLSRLERSFDRSLVLVAATDFPTRRASKTAPWYTRRAIASQTADPGENEGWGTRS